MEKLSSIILLPGFRFNPKDEELVVLYLKPKIQSLPLPYPIPEADFCGSDPWDLPGDWEEERYFFSMVQTEHPNGVQTDRTTPSGYWKPFGIDKEVYDSQKNLVGTKKNLVFYILRPRHLIKTNWIMHEYKVVNPTHGMQNWMICRVFLMNSAKNLVMENEEVTQVLTNYFEVIMDFGCGSSSFGPTGVTFAGEDEDEDENEEISE